MNYKNTKEKKYIELKSESKQKCDRRKIRFKINEINIISMF